MARNLFEDQQKPDPWTGRQADTKKNGQPPNLEVFIRAFWSKLKGQGSRSFTPKAMSNSVIVLVVIIWLSLGAHYVRTDQLTYVLRLGVYQGQLAPGWQWRAWGLYQVHTLPQPLTLTLASEVMSQDLNLAKVSLQFSYRVNNLKAYLYRIAAPQQVLLALAQSALQQVVGSSPLEVLQSEKNPLAVDNQFKMALQALVDQAGLGVSVTAATIEQVAIPDALQELFNKMNALYVVQTEEKQKNLDYQQQVLPPVVLKTQQALTAATAYEQQVIHKADTDVADFLSLLPSYHKAPALIKEQLYRQNMTSLLSAASTVIVDAKGLAPTIVLESPSKKSSAAVEASPIVSATDDIDNDNDSYGNTKGGYG